MVNWMPQRKFLCESTKATSWLEVCVYEAFLNGGYGYPCRRKAHVDDRSGLTAHRGLVSDETGLITRYSLTEGVLHDNENGTE